MKKHKYSLHLTSDSNKPITFQRLSSFTQTNPQTKIDKGTSLLKLILIQIQKKTTDNKLFDVLEQAKQIDNCYKVILGFITKQKFYDQLQKAVLQTLFSIYSNILIILHRYSKAVKIIKILKIISSLYPTQTRIKCKTYLQLGTCFLQTGDTEKAFKYLMKYLQYAWFLESKQDQFNAFKMLSKYSYYNSQLNNAQAYNNRYQDQIAQSMDSEVREFAVCELQKKLLRQVKIKEKKKVQYVNFQTKQFFQNDDSIENYPKFFYNPEISKKEGQPQKSSHLRFPLKTNNFVKIKMTKINNKQKDKGNQIKIQYNFKSLQSFRGIKLLKSRHKAQLRDKVIITHLSRNRFLSNYSRQKISFSKINQQQECFLVKFENKQLIKENQNLIELCRVFVKQYRTYCKDQIDKFLHKTNIL